ncbi:hypothetical protein PM082_009912 [Marasmius tenuissimus]|nr:hypothetical protein PM082_009912 [Marasmius tenuissimus]
MPATHNVKSTNATGRIPRPANPFILFRRDALENGWVKLTYSDPQTGKEKKKRQSTLSKEIGALWTGMAQDVKKRYQDLAEQARSEHKRLYPDYQYRPQRKLNKEDKRLNRLPSSPGTSSAATSPSPEAESSAALVMSPSMFAQHSQFATSSLVPFVEETNASPAGLMFYYPDPQKMDATAVASMFQPEDFLVYSHFHNSDGHFPNFWDPETSQWHTIPIRSYSPLHVELPENLE